MLTALFDGPAALIVVGGTMLGTVLRCGPGAIGTTFSVLGTLGEARFDAASARAGLAGQINDIRRDGLLCAPVRAQSDAECAEAADALISRRSITAVLERHRANQTQRSARAKAAVHTLSQAAELGPVAGLAGTLVSLSQLPTGGLGHGALSGAIAMAVLTTLYGLLVANLIFAPLARMVERRTGAELAARQELIDWLAAQAETVLPPLAVAPVRRAGRDTGRGTGLAA